ncbi:MAG: 50S ribosomal protein L25/general stress protein Ctc [Pseudomonadota bacterium]|nr:50S ribosomal protein L25/general stress protein Ctc [Pseudomonadota bacterium]
MQSEFTAFPRGTEGRGASRRLRRSGRAPGIVYGAGVEPTPIELDHNALFHALRGEAFHSSILTMTLDGAATKVLLRDVQMHPFKNEILHVDFQRIDEAKKIRMRVPLHFMRAEDSSAQLAGAVISHVATEIEVACLPRDLPEFIEVDLSTLEAGGSIHLSALKLPEGVTAVSHGKTDPVVAAAVVPRGSAETEEATAATAEAAPAADAPAAAKSGTKAPEAKGGDKKDSGGKDDKKK